MDASSGLAALELTKITKRFSDTGVIAVDHVSFSVFPGEIHALVGENGAGKTTLARIMAGLAQADSGGMAVSGRPVRFRDVHDAHANGISMLQQNDTLALNLSSAENMVLGCEPRRFSALYDDKKAARNFSQAVAAFGISLDPDIQVSRLGPVERRYVSLARALLWGKSVLILDEPTSILSEGESRRFFATLEPLKKQGLAIILVSHRMAEVVSVADRITVMREGMMSVSVPGSQIKEYELAHMAANISGQQGETAKEPRNSGEVVFAVQGLSFHPENNSRSLDAVSFQVRSGEIFGIAAIAGNGLDLLESIVAGEKLHFDGTVKLRGKNLDSYPRPLLRASLLAYIPTERDLKGLCLDEALHDSLIARRASGLAPVYFRHPEALAKLAEGIQVSFPSLSPMDMTPRALSGGNRQRAVAARELDAHSTFVIAASPSQGLDPAAQQEMWDALMRSAGRGAAVLLLSSRLEEIIALCDRVGVLYRGKLSGDQTKPFDHGHLSSLMAGLS